MEKRKTRGREGGREGGKEEEQDRKKTYLFVSVEDIESQLARVCLHLHRASHACASCIAPPATRAHLIGGRTALSTQERGRERGREGGRARTYLFVPVEDTERQFPCVSFYLHDASCNPRTLHRRPHNFHHIRIQPHSYRGFHQPPISPPSLFIHAGQQRPRSIAPSLPPSLPPSP